MTEFKTTDWFTLVPKELAGKDTEPEEAYRKIMKELYPLSDEDKVFHIDIPDYQAVLLYSWKHAGAVEEDVRPEISEYIFALSKIPEHNKAILRYVKAENSEDSSTLILIADGSDLIAANHYHTTDFGSAIYYLMEILKQSQMNPKQTSVHVIGEISADDKEQAEKYVRRCIVNQL
ncbi:MAG: DUF3822 family protein [Candidatus Egerieousia sp.]